jgi:hypothetical protein
MKKRRVVCAVTQRRQHKHTLERIFRVDLQCECSKKIKKLALGALRSGFMWGAVAARNFDLSLLEERESRELVDRDCRVYVFPNWIMSQCRVFPSI